MRIQFSIFCSPIDAYGNVSGDITDPPELPEVGDVLSIFSAEDIKDYEIESTVELQVEALDEDNAGGFVVSFEGIVVGNEMEAERLMRCSEERHGLWAFRYPPQ